MELDHHNPLLIFYAHHGIGQTFGCKSFTNTRRALENNIFLGPNQIDEGIILLLVHIDILQKFCFIVGRICNDLFFPIVIRVSSKQRAKFFYIVCIRSNICQSFQDSLTTGVGPLPLVRPIDRSTMGIRRIRFQIFIFGCNNTPSNDLGTSFLNKDHVTDLNLVCKLPCGMSRIHISQCRIVCIFHFLLHSFLAIESTQITNLSPANGHDAIFVESIPHCGTFTGSIHPVPNALCFGIR